MSLVITLALVLVASLQYTSAQASSGCVNNPADIVFILDSSTSIWTPDFKKQIEFVKNVTKQFDVGPTALHTRVGALTFGHEVWPQFNLKDNLKPSLLSTDIGKITHKYGRRTKTGAAIQYAVDHMFTRVNGSRDDVSKIAVVITDGRSQRFWETAQAADAAHAAGIKVFAIGVGKRIDGRELSRIASDPDRDYVFNVTSYNALLSFTKKFAEQTCKVTAKPTIPTTTPEVTTPLNIRDVDCKGKPAEVLFVVDASSSITRKNFNKELDFVQKVVKMFDIGLRNTRVGVITFSRGANMDIRLDNKLSKEDLMTEVIKINQAGGGTNTGEALRMARHEGFARNVVRPGVAKIAIVLTDGLSRDDRATADQAQMLHDSDVTTFAIGIGNGVDIVEIKAIASDPDEQYVYQVDDFNSLDSIKDLLADRACSVIPGNIEEKPKDQPACDIKKLTDLMFIYDTSILGAAQTDAISQYIATIVGRLDFTGGYLHVGRSTDNCPSGGNFVLTDKWSPLDFANIRTSTFSTFIKQVRRSGFSSEYGGRDGAAKIGILFVDSSMGYLDANALAELKALSKASELFVVSVGSGPAINQFKSQFNRRNVISLRSYVDLDGSAGQLLAKFCQHLKYNDYNIDYVIPK